MIAVGGNFETELDVIEFGRRVALYLDSENNCWGAANMLWWNMQDWEAENGRESD